MLGGRKTFRKELEQKDQQIDKLIWEASGLKADVNCLISGMRHAAIYLQRCDQNDYRVMEAIERLERSYNIVTRGHLMEDVNAICDIPLNDSMQA